VCQNQTIAESNAPLAVDLREQVRLQLAAGKGQAEITRYLTDRYGDFVLYRQPFKPTTVLLWAGPFLLLLAGLFWVWRLLRARPVAPPPRVVSEAEVMRLLEETRNALQQQDKPHS
jgi:cytochrome c-type biogenesis protein CcmH